MKFYHSPGTCSLGIHILLEELSVPYESVAIDVRKGQQFSPEFQTVNPKGKVPALIRDDGSLLTEFQAIAFWLARAHPETGLIPGDVDGQARVLELLDYIVGSVHMRGFTLFMVPQKFVQSDVARAELAEHGRNVAAQALAFLSESLGKKDYLFSNFTIADAALFYVTEWARVFHVEMLANLHSFNQRMRARPAVMRALSRQAQ